MNRQAVALRVQMERLVQRYEAGDLSAYRKIVALVEAVPSDFVNSQCEALLDRAAALHESRRRPLSVSRVCCLLRVRRQEDVANALRGCYRLCMRRDTAGLKQLLHQLKGVYFHDSQAQATLNGVAERATLIIIEEAMAARRMVCVPVVGLKAIERLLDEDRLPERLLSELQAGDMEQIMIADGRRAVAFLDLLGVSGRRASRSRSNAQRSGKTQRDLRKFGGSREKRDRERRERQAARNRKVTSSKSKK